MLPPMLAFPFIAGPGMGIGIGMGVGMFMFMLLFMGICMAAELCGYPFTAEYCAPLQAPLTGAAWSTFP
jgi:hypothetical protein